MLAHKEVLQQVVAVLLLSPSLERSQDVFHVVENFLTFNAQSSRLRVDSATRLDGIRIEDELDHLRQLFL